MNTTITNLITNLIALGWDACECDGYILIDGTATTVGEAWDLLADLNGWA